MIYIIKKYIYFELLILLRVVNHWMPLDKNINIAIVAYLTVLGFIYILFKYIFENHKSVLLNCNFRNKHVCIIGGSEGLGLSLAKKILHEKPHTVSILARNVSKLEKAKNILINEMIKKDMNVKINIIQCNLASKESINEAFENVLMNKSLDTNEYENNINFVNKKTQNEELNPNDINSIDVLICNAAYVSTNENEKLQLSDLLNTINTNIYGNIDFISKAVLHMKNKKVAIKSEQIQSNEKDKNNKFSKQNGHPGGGMIVFINSEGALYPVYGYSYYLMSKSCMWIYNNILDQELKHFNIHIVNAFLPSIETPGYAQENLTKPLITKKIEAITSTLNSDYTAKKVIEKIKQGKKFITLDINGFFLSILHSGYRNPDCYFDYLMSVSFFGLLVFISSLYKVYIEYIIYTNK
ncbi:conserved Plasmodium protein, unknown function [Plasmodium chabaudi adami]|uniref:Ketoreductase (KR) domain-containing protein n=1 Tax=Plasmodium chabaudi adami TaxID=5826 RepID=A0A1D3LK13_PLACE|nr:conserved Plasmodium protein, unknown function [Plasmodium chabaudi adami]